MLRRSWRCSQITLCDLFLAYRGRWARNQAVHVAIKSSWEEAGRTEETRRLCWAVEAYAKKIARHRPFHRFGTSPLGLFLLTPIYIVRLINDRHELPTAGYDQESLDVELALGSFGIPRNRPFILVAKLGFEVNEPRGRGVQARRLSSSPNPWAWASWASDGRRSKGDGPHGAGSQASPPLGQRP